MDNKPIPIALRYTRAYLLHMLSLSREELEQEAAHLAAWQASGFDPLDLLHTGAMQ